MHSFSRRLYRAARTGTTTAAVLALACFSGLLPCAPFAPCAHAQDQNQDQDQNPDEPAVSDEKRALTMFAAAEDLYREGRFEDAVELLLEARRLHEEPVINYNLARAYEELAQPGEAARAYRRYLALETGARDRAVIEARIERLERATDAGAGVGVGVGPTVDQSPSPAPTLVDGERRDAEGSTVAPWLTLSAGAAALAAGAVFGALSRNSRAESVEATVNAEAIDAFDRAKTYATIANVCFVGGGILAAVGGGWLVLSALSGDGAESGVTVGVGLGSMSVRGTWP